MARKNGEIGRYHKSVTLRLINSVEERSVHRTVPNGIKQLDRKLCSHCENGLARVRRNPPDRQSVLHGARAGDVRF